MTATMTEYWLVVVLITIGTFLLRFSFLHWLGQRQLPERLEAVLGLVPAAVLCALIVPNLMFRDGVLDIGLSNPRLLAGALALVVAMITRDLFLPILAGMIALWSLTAWWS